MHCPSSPSVNVETATPWRWRSWCSTSFPVFPKEKELLRTLRNAGHLLESQQNLLESQKAAEQKARELEEVNAIGIALSAERDHERLLNLILTKTREITCADAGSLFLVESIDMPIGAENRTGDQQRVHGRWLRFRLAQNDSRDFKFEEDVLAITPESIAGLCSRNGRYAEPHGCLRSPAGQAFHDQP